MQFYLGDVIKMEKDDHCFFHAIVYGFSMVGLGRWNHETLRSNVVDYLHENIFLNDDVDVLYHSRSFESANVSKRNDLTFRAFFCLFKQANTNDKLDKKRRELEDARGSRQINNLMHAIELLEYDRVENENCFGSSVVYKNMFGKYLEDMRGNAWATDIEIWALHKMFYVNVDVYGPPKLDGTLLEMNLCEDPNKPTIRLYNESGASTLGLHYDALPASLSLASFSSTSRP